MKSGENMNNVTQVGKDNSCKKSGKKINGVTQVGKL